jgi:hypothetical protein
MNKYIKPEGKEYQEHVIFSTLKKYSDFYETLSDNIFGFISTGTTTPFNIDTYMFMSMQGTLNSISEILAKGRINDSYALLRKYYDSAIINIYSTVYLEENRSFENFIVQKIDRWLKGEEGLPEYRVMSKYIRDSQKLAPLNALLYKNDTYKKLRDRCNDHTHYNYYYNLLLNDGKLYIANRLKHLDRFKVDLQNIFILHLSYLFYLNDHYMASSDYVDSLECDMTPEEGSQYWVAPFVQEIYDTVLKKYREDLAAEIKANTMMQLAKLTDRT